MIAGFGTGVSSVSYISARKTRILLTNISFETKINVLLCSRFTTCSLLVLSASDAPETSVYMRTTIVYGVAFYSVTQIIREIARTPK